MPSIVLRKARSIATHTCLHCQELIAVQMGMVHLALGKMPREEPAAQVLIRRGGG